MLLAALVVAGTAWAYLDWQDRVGADVTADDPMADRPIESSASAAPTSSPTEPPATETGTRPVSLWLGDGYTTGYACATAEELDWECVVEAEEGAGFVNATTGARLVDRLGDVVDEGVDPDVVLVDAGRNDLRLVDGPNLRTAMDAYLDALREAFPDAALVQVVPWTLAQEGPLPGGVAALVTEVAEEHDGYAVDPVAEGWAGTGHTDRADLRDPEGGASTAGDAYVARNLADALADLDLPVPAAG